MTDRDRMAEADALRELLTNRQMPDNGKITVTLGELRAAFAPAQPPDALRAAAQRLADRLNRIRLNRIDLEFPWEAEYLGLSAALAATTPPAPAEAPLDVPRVAQAIAAVAKRHGVVKDPPPPLALMRIYGYTTAPAVMDAEIAAEYARLAPQAEPRHGYTCGWCDWGRDTDRTRGEYEVHKAETGHVGEPRP